MDYDLFPGLDGPASAAADNPVTLGVQWNVLGVASAWLRGYRFWRATTAITGSPLGRTYQVLDALNGAQLGDSDATFVLAGTGWQTALLAAPVPIAIGVAYRAAVHFPSGYSSTSDYFTTGPGVGGLVSGPLRAPDVTGTVGGDQGSFHYGPSNAYPDGSFHGGNYWLSPIVTDVDPDEGGGPDPDDPAATDYYLAGRVRAGWAPGAIGTGWAAGRTRTGWQPGRIV